MIELVDVHKRFGAVQALAGVSFTIRDGLITGLLGPNGAGKTTALRVLYGVLEPDRGRAAVDGLDVARERTAAQRRLGVLPHAHGLYPRLTTREHLAYFGRLHGIGGAPLEARVEEALDLLELRPIADRRTDGSRRDNASRSPWRGRSSTIAKPPPRRADRRARRGGHPRAANAPAPIAGRGALCPLLLARDAGGLGAVRRGGGDGARQGGGGRIARGAAARHRTPLWRTPSWRPSARRRASRRRSLSLAVVVLRKELLDSLRERRALAMALLFPLFGPAVLTMALWVGGTTAHGGVERPLALPVAGAEHAPELVAFLRSAGVEVTRAPADPERAVRAGEREVVLVIPPQFGERLRAGRPAPVRLLLDASRQSAQPAIMRARALLEGYGRQLGLQRLLVRGVHPGLVQGILVEESELSTPESRTALVLNVLPYFVILAIFVGGMATAIDTTTGERERQSLEPLLANPVPRSGLALAKIGATAAFAAVALLETLVGFGVVPLLLPAASLGFTVRLYPAPLLRTFVLCLPLVALLSALQILVAARARSFRRPRPPLAPHAGAGPAGDDARVPPGRAPPLDGARPDARRAARGDAVLAW